MHYLYGSKKGVARKLVATFSSEQQLRAYVRWATLHETGPRAGKFEQGSPLAGYNSWEESTEPLTDDDKTSVVHNPTPSML
jgi:redox-regulated HSP33 family molecular chaperone